MKNYWDLLAAQFQHQQPPLRPCAADVAILEKIVSAAGGEKKKVLLLGVTPEIAGMSWPDGTSLVAIEKSQPMIDLVWPGDVPDRRQVILGNWFEAKFPPETCDFVVGDGFTTGLAYPLQYRALAKSVAGWLKLDGRFVARLFTRTMKQETRAAILADLKAGRIPRFDILKWRLGMALQKDAREGVAVGDIYRAWKEIEHDWPSLPEDAGWPRTTVNTIQLYAGRTNRYAFPNQTEINAAFAETLEPVSTFIPEYDFGECCPTLIYRRRTGQ